MGFYDRLMISKRINYILYWSIAGAALFLLAEIVRSISGERQITTLSVLILVISFILLIVCSQSTARSFKNVMKDVQLIVDFPVENWCDEKFLQLFSLRTWKAKLVVSIFTASFLVTVILTGLPVETTLVKTLGWIALPFLLFVPGFAAYFYIHLLITLHQIVRFPIKSTFYRVDHPSVLSLYRFYSNNTLFMLLLYICFNACVLSLYDPRSAIGIWIVILALYPLGYFILSFAQIHVLMYQLKQKNIDIVNHQVVTVLTQLQKEPTKETAEILTQLMDIQKRIESMREWPASVQGIFTFLVATVTPVAQLALSLWSMIKK